jgi:hypothetical protein
MVFKISRTMKHLYLFILFLFILQSCDVFDDPGTQRVKGGSFNECNSISVEKLSSNFFSNPEWAAIQAADGNKYINLSGGMTYYEKPVNALIQFSYPEVDYGSFEIVAFEMNGIPQNQLMINGLVKSMCEASLD